MSRENVRISDRGRNLLNNKELANKVVSAIIKGKENFRAGVPVIVDGSTISVQLVTALTDQQLSQKKEFAHKKGDS